MVVIEVKKIGCIRATPPSIMELKNSIPLAMFLLIQSINTIESLTTIPDNDTMPINAVKEKRLSKNIKADYNPDKSKWNREDNNKWLFE